MYASKMMAKIATTSQKKNHTIPGMLYPPTVLARATLVLATALSYSLPPNLFGGCQTAGGSAPTGAIMDRMSAPAAAAH